MAAPEHVRILPELVAPSYGSPDHVPSPWSPDRPGDLERSQPEGQQFGSQGPDQGYVLLLARRLRDKLQLTPGEHPDDALAGAVAIALRRASMFGRAPVIHDLTVALTIWGYLDPSPPAELVALRRTTFEGLADPHHYVEIRDLAQSVPEATLRSTPDAVRRLHQQDWRQPLGL